MIQFVTITDSFYLSSMVPDIEIVCYDSLTFTLSRGGTEILKEKYWGNSKSRVWVRDLGKVIAADLGDVPGLSAVYTLSALDGNTSDTKTFRVLMGERPVDKLSNSYVQNNFLTLLSGAKITRPWQREILSIYTDTAVDVQINVVNLEGVYSGNSLLRTISETGQVTEMDVSPENILSNPDSVRRYVISAGTRTMVFHMIHDERREEPELIFRNAFGCRESFVPSGLVERENEYENVNGYVRDMLFRFRTKEIKKFSANTGILNEDHAAWVEDCFVSNELFLLVGSDLVPVTIIDAKPKRSNAPDELVSFDFNYQLSRPNIYGAGKIDIKRIFDDTFDYTFH